MRRRAFPALLALAALLACAGCDDFLGSSDSAPQARLGEPLTLRMGETGVVSDARLYLTFEDVTEDTRCPVDAECLQPGDARVELSVVRSGEPQEKLALRLHDVAPVALDGFEFRLTGLEPQRTVARPEIPREEYRATVVAIEPTDAHALQVRLRLVNEAGEEKAVFPWGAPVGLELEVTNATGVPKDLVFGSSQRYDFTVSKREGLRVWRWSDHRGFFQVIGYLTISAGETVRFVDSWDQAGEDGPVAPGSFEARGYFPSYGGWRSEPVAFEIR